MLARLIALFGVLALLVASVGLYGVSAYSVARRTAEIGIRMALGAERAKVTAMILRAALIQTALGLAIGLPIALLCVRFVQSQLYEVKGIDVTVLFGSVLVLVMAASMAGLIPARRAASIDPGQGTQDRLRLSPTETKADVKKAASLGGLKFIETRTLRRNAGRRLRSRRRPSWRPPLRSGCGDGW